MTDRSKCQMLKNQQGLGLITVIIFGAIISAAVYAGYQIIPFFYYYYEIRNQFEQVIKVASVETDEEIRKKLMYHIKKYQLPVESEDLRIERSSDIMTISLKYQEVFYVTWQGKDYDVHTFDFDATVKGRFK